MGRVKIYLLLLTSAVAARKLSEMRKFFFAAFIWEFLRFFFIAVSAREKTGSDMIIWLASQQVVMIYLCFFLWYNADKYRNFLKAAAAGKLMGVVAGSAYLAGIMIKKTAAAGILFTANIIIVDSLFMFMMLFLAGKYFRKQPRE